MSDVPPEIEALRKAIDGVDDQMVDLLAKREELVEQVAKIKAELGMSVVQASRFQEILARLQARAEKKDVDPILIESVWEAIHSYSVLKQKRARDVSSS